MSSQQRVFTSSSPGAGSGLGGADPRGSPLSEMETLRVFVTERLTAAVEDILGVFGETVARYREQVERQQRQLDSLRSEEDKWSPEAELLQASSWRTDCPVDLIHQTSSVTDSSAAAAHVKTEADGGASEPEPDLDPAAGAEAADGGPLHSGRSDTEDSGDYWTEAGEPWRPEQAEGQSSGQRVESSTHLSHELPFRCRVCGEAFHSKSHLLTHSAAHGRDCGVCGEHLGRSEDLKLHLRVHRETAFCCGVCGQSFTLRGNLRAHMRIHSGERPFGCSVCGKSFGRRATLVRHVRSHTGEKPFTCTHCGRAFVEKGNLTVHLRTHTGERPYWCSTCDRRFSQLSCFYKHPCQRRRAGSALVNPT